MTDLVLSEPIKERIVRHDILGGLAGIYKRENSRFWQAAAFIAGKNHRVSTHEEELSKAKDFAEDWFLELRGKHKRGELSALVEANAETTFREAAEQFLREFSVITEGQRSDIYVEGHRRRVNLHLVPFMGDKPLSQVTSGLIQDYRVNRIEKAKALYSKPPARNTLHQEIVVIRQVLKLALRHGWLKALPDMTEPYRKNGKISHRAWFSPEEYKKLYEASRARTLDPEYKRWRHTREQLHDYILFMVNTGLRPDESLRLQYRDVTIADDRGTGETILEIEVRGKRGVGYCKSMPGAVHPFKRLLKRNKPSLTDLIFPVYQFELFNSLLEETDLKFDREGRPRTFYSLRHTYICLRLMEGADIYQIAKNCRTSVEMIEKFYAAHIKDRLDASAINIRKKKLRPKKTVAGKAKSATKRSA